MSASRLPRLLRLYTALGAVLWAVWWVLGGSQGEGESGIGFALAGGVTVVVPLALLHAHEPDRDGGVLAVFRWLVLAWPLTAPLALLALLGAPGALSAALAMPWFVTTALAGAFGLRRLLRRSHPDLAGAAIDAGLIYLPVGGVWLLASRAGVPLLGFSEPWTSLTAAHFHFAGLGVPVLAGLTGVALPRLLRADEQTAPVVRGAWRAVAVAAIVGPPLTALGIASSRWIELLGAAVMLFGAVGVGAFILVLAATAGLPGRSRPLLGLAGAVPVATSAMALIYAGSTFLGTPFPSLSAMVRYHGVVNALAFVATGLVGFALAGVGSERPAPGVPFSRLRAGGAVGRWFFRSQGAVDETRPAPVGLVGSMESFARAGVHGLHDLDPGTLHPAVRAFYERTSEVRFQVTPRWFPPASWLAPLVLAGARSIGQLELPFGSAEARSMGSELVALRSSVDGRQDVRGWIRTHPDGERPVFVAAYAVHRDRGVPYMNIAMPLPGANLSSVLRVDPGSHGGLVLTTRALRAFAGDEGIYLVTPWGEWALPMHETLVIGPAVGRGPDDLAARHEVHVLGLRVLELTYLIEPSAP